MNISLHALNIFYLFTTSRVNKVNEVGVGSFKLCSSLILALCIDYLNTYAVLFLSAIWVFITYSLCITVTILTFDKYFICSVLSLKLTMTTISRPFSELLYSLILERSVVLSTSIFNLIYSELHDASSSSSLVSGPLAIGW